MFEDFEYLVYFLVPGEKGFAGTHLRKYTADGPHIDARRILASAKEDLRGAVPECHDLTMNDC